ncbi:HK97 gp10 family phage protein [Actinoallomurus iriomotensis]|uniref:HK97 gp10 family phage protein n=1 Tax=Actinoallomurus iriomotensis TaxID=478107 RepID=A0A9W6RUL1_9ACTN|nr:HK97 gp10 family phage protein [Actinoallomurus iriomotensis]GLY81839.1 hypothetical protein Airi01_101060 [Actinoallomurus iriomotensis]
MSVDRRELQQLIRDLEQVPPAIRREFRSGGMLRAARPALQEVRHRASWSTRIPGATTMSLATGSRAGVRIRVSAARAPHARPYEHGGSPGTFRHPVYGNRRNWQPQAARPFLRPGVEAARPQVAEAMADVVMDVAHQHGL